MLGFYFRQACILILIVLQGGQTLIGQSGKIRFEHLTTDDGLSNGSVTSIFQDSRGFIWFGTVDGLNKYDGYDFTIYRHSRYNPLSIGDNKISDITEDAEGNLWIATNSVLVRFDRKLEAFHSYNLSVEHESIVKSHISDVMIDSEGKLWVVNAGAVLIYNKSTDSFGKFDFSKDKSGNFFNDFAGVLFEDSKENIWIGTKSGGVVLYSKKEQKLSTYLKSEFGKYAINSILEDRYGGIWLGTDDNVAVLQLNDDYELVKEYVHNGNKEGSISSGPVKYMYKDSKDNIWIATRDGLNLYNEEKDNFTNFYHNPNDIYSLSGNEIWSIFEDERGSVWFGSYTEGVNVYHPEHTVFKNWCHNPDLPNSLATNSVYSFVENEDGTFWIGLDHGGLMLFDLGKGALKHYKNIPGDNSSLSSNSVLSLHKDSKGNLWVGTFDGGLNLFNEKTGKFKRLKYYPEESDKLNNQTVWSIEEDSRGRLWIGVMGAALYKYDYDKNEFKGYHAVGGQISNISTLLVNTVFEDSKKNIWIGTANGLRKYNEGTDDFTIYEYDENNIRSLSNNMVISIFEDKNNKLWLGTEEGLNVFDPETGKFKAFFIEDGLPSNVIKAIISDENDNIWISSNGGLTKIPVESLNSSGEPIFVNFDKSDGLTGINYNFNSALRSGKELLFGSTKGFVFFNPAKIKSNQYAPPVVLTDFKIFNRTVDIDREGVCNSPLNKHISETDQIILKYDHSVFSFEFSALNYTASNKNKYSYKLINFDDNWSDCHSTRRHVTYTNIPPGEYTFIVNGSNNDGVWSNKAASVKIIILPPWWKTWWFYTIAIIAAISLIWFIFWLRVRAVKRSNIKLEKLVKERTHEIEEKSEEIKIQNEEIQTTLENLRSTQSQLVQSEKMASLGQLIAGIAHEINTPLGAINASIGSIVAAMDESFIRVPELIRELPIELQILFFDLIGNGAENHVCYTSREERAYKKKLKEQLTELGFEDANKLAAKLISIGLFENIDKYLPLLQNKNVDLILKAANSLSEQKKNSNNIKQAVERASKIVFALKNFSRHDMSGEKVNFDIRENIDTVLTLYHNQLKHGIEVIKTYDKVDNLDCYPDELSQVWTNIIHNAIHAMDNKGILNIDIRKKDRGDNEYLSVAITDNGKGIPEDVKERIFEPFYTTKAAGEGSGLGLDIVNKIIEKHNGKIEVESEVGKGTTFTILLPYKTEKVI